MPHAVKGTSEEREKFMFEIFQRFYSDPTNAGKELSVDKANKEMIKKFGSMLRNKRSYQLRASAKAQAGVKPTEGSRFRSQARGLAPVEPGSKTAAALVEGTGEQIAWLKGVLEQLRGSGLAQARIDHSTDSYAVISRT